MADEYKVFIEASVRGYHAYSKDATEVLICERELDNAYDKYAVAVNNEQGKVVGHVPIELSKVFARFIRNYGEVNKYNTRSSRKLHISYKRTNYGKFSIKYKGAQIWNSLPTILRDIKSKYIFRKKIKQFIQQEHDLYLEEA